MKLLFPFILLAASISVIIYELNKEVTAYDLYMDKAKDYYDDYKYKSAIKAFDLAIKEDSLSAEAYYKQGMSYVQLDNLQKGDSLIRIAANIDKDEYGVKYEMAKYSELYDLYYGVDIDKIPDNSMPDDDLLTEDIILLADEYYKEGEFEKAINYYNEAVKTDINDTKSLYNIGKCYYNLENYDKAIEYYDRTIAIDYKFENAYFERGFTKYVLQDYSGAFDDYEAFIVLSPETPAAYINRGLCKYNLDDKKGACADFEIAEGLGADVSSYNEDYCNK